MNFLDRNTLGMCLSNMECADLESAVVDSDWSKVYNYMKKKLEKQGEQKPVWSEEDEKMLVEIVNDLQVCKSRDISRAAKDAYQKEIDWLKSLKERYTWKPSEEQMIALHQVISGCSYDIEPLVELETKLKKL